MDIKRFDSVTNANRGMKMALIDPVTKRDSGAGLVLYGADSAMHKNARKEIDAKNRSLGRALSTDELEEQTLDLISRCTENWYGLEENGVTLEFSQAKAKDLYRAYPEIAERATTFIFTRANFFATASES
jgi:hypothetical protein